MPIDVKVKHQFSTDNNTNGTDFHPTQPWLLTGNAFRVTIHNLESGAVIHTFSLSPFPVFCVKFIPRKNWYVVGSQSGRLLVFDCDTHKMVVAVKAHTHSIACLAIHPTASVLLTGSNGNIKAWDWEKQWQNIQTYKGHTHWINSITFNPKDLNTFASASHDRTVIIWSITSPVPAIIINAHDKAVNCVDFCPGTDKPYLVTASDDTSIKVWDYLSQTCIYTMTGHTNKVIFAVFHPSLSIILSGGLDHTVKIWDSKSYGIEDTLDYRHGWAKCVALRKDTSEVAVGFNAAVVTLKLAHRVPIDAAVLRDDMSGVVSKEQVHELVRDRHTKEIAMSVTEDPAHNLELAQPPDCLTTLCDAPSLIPPSTTPSLTMPPTPSLISPSTTPPSHAVYQHKVDPYQYCSTLAMELMVAKSTNKLISELRGDDAQYVADFLSKMVSDQETSFTRRDRKHSLHLLSKLAKSAEVFPQSLELEGVQCNLSNFFVAGGYGFIYKGDYEGKPVCIKAVQIGYQGIDRKKMRAHASELTIWAHLEHPNVLPFLGIYASKEEVPRICIVSPWMINGDLFQYLRNVPDASRKPLVRDILLGLQYLHDLDIIHADLKAKNVLVSETGKAMLADFGISRLSITLTTNLTNAGTGTVYWMAPELLLDYEPHSRESDVWAFACTCYEIITGAMPFSECEHPQRLKHAFKKGNITPLVPEKPGPGWDEDVWSVAIRCWQSDPANRPKAHELLDMINSFTFSDDRPSDYSSQTKRNDCQIDYDRISDILNDIRQSTESS